MIIKNADAGLLLKHVIVTELSIVNQLAGSAAVFDENAQTLDMDYDIIEAGSDENCYFAEIRLKTRIIVKIEKKKVFDMKIGHLSLFIAPKEAFENDDQFIKTVELGGIASLISYVRANIASITGLTFCEGNIMLPMINVFKLNKLKSESKKIT